MNRHDRPRRRSIRITDYDYSQGGAYYVTVCCRKRQSLFGNVVNGRTRLNQCGRIALRCWNEIPDHFPNVQLDAHVLMPNHLHGILIIREETGTACRAPTNERFSRPVGGSVPTIIRSFKSAVTRRFNEIRGIRVGSLWQRNYFEHVIRDEESLDKIREYIATNAERWQLDRENLQREGTDKFDEWLESFKDRPDRSGNAQSP